MGFGFQLICYNEIAAIPADRKMKRVVAMCTTIKVDYDGGSILGRNMDWDMEVNYHISYLPAGYEYAHDLYGKPLVSKYRMLGLCFRTLDPLKDGVNEHGLMGCTNMFLHMNLYASKVDPEKTNISSLDFFNHILGNYKTVAEVVADLPNLHIAKKDHLGNRAICPDFHWYFADETGDSILIEPRGTELKACPNEYRVMTNSPSLDHHIRALEKTFQQGGREFQPAKDLPGGYDPVSRFIKAYYLNEHIADAVTREDALENAYSILEALKIPEAFTKTKYDYTFTRYISAYDAVSRLLTVRSHMNPRIHSVALADVAHLTEKTLMEVPRHLQMDPIVPPEEPIPSIPMGALPPVKRSHRSR